MEMKEWKERFGEANLTHHTEKLVTRARMGGRIRKSRKSRKSRRKSRRGNR